MAKWPIALTGMRLYNSLALPDDNTLIRSHRRERFRLASQPGDGDIGLGRFAQSEVDSEIALRNVVSTTAHLIDLLVGADSHRDPRTDSIAGEPFDKIAIA